MNDIELLQQIEPTIERAYQEHTEIGTGVDMRIRDPIDPLELLGRASSTNDNDPHVHGPVLRESYTEFASDFAEMTNVDLRPTTAASYLVNTLTEDNLPYYTWLNMNLSTFSPALRDFARTWVAEEHPHGVSMRDLALHTTLIAPGGTIEPRVYHEGLVQQLKTGTEIAPPTIYNALAYLSLQEYLTQEAHTEVGWLVDPMSRIVLRTIAGDEVRHYNFYRKLSQAALEVEPDQTMVGMAEEYKRFQMPGRIGIPEFDINSLTIAVSGIFDLATIVRSQRHVADKLGIANVQATTDQGKKAQQFILKWTSDRRIEREVAKMESLRDMAMENVEPGELLPFILGRTIEFTQQGAPGHERRIGLQAIAS